MVVVAADEVCVDSAFDALKNGEIVAVPTDTVYGLAVDLNNVAAILKLFVLKNRPAERQIAVLVSDVDMAEKLVILSEKARRLATEFWPGPLTLVAQRRSSTQKSMNTTIDTSTTLGVRLPDHELVRRLAGVGPLAVTSANLHGQPTPATAQEIAKVFPSLSMVVDGGRLEGTASTVVDVAGLNPIVLREGPIAAEQILGLSDDQFI
ncbi:MAG: L-threonylcarbamoyladenylate synthase [Acidimicrobiaceae bacterium]|nr:L-threonylcarbamoyladenylate synthase [Acidimicrobiaceae bacterium]